MIKITTRCPTTPDLFSERRVVSLSLFFISLSLILSPFIFWRATRYREDKPIFCHPHHLLRAEITRSLPTRPGHVFTFPFARSSPSRLAHSRFEVLPHSFARSHSICRRRVSLRRRSARKPSSNRCYVSAAGANKRIRARPGGCDKNKLNVVTWPRRNVSSGPPDRMVCVVRAYHTRAQQRTRGRKMVETDGFSRLSQRSIRGDEDAGFAGTRKAPAFSLSL